MTEPTTTTTSSNPSKVVVISGGYAGTLAANHLRMRSDVDITLVNPRPRFVERVRLHQHAAGTADATVDYGTLLGEGVRLVVDSATRIDTTASTVHLESGRALGYDYVIYVGGRLGAVIKEKTCQLGVSRIRREAREPGSYAWIKGGRRLEQPVYVAREAVGR